MGDKRWLVCRRRFIYAFVFSVNLLSLTHKFAILGRTDVGYRARLLCHLYSVGGNDRVVGESLTGFGIGASLRRKVRPYVVVPRRRYCGRATIFGRLLHPAPWPC